MLTHVFDSPKPPKRVVVLGARGFVGQTTSRRLQADGINVLPLGREELDLLSQGAAAKLAGLLREFDCLLVVSAKAPVKNQQMFDENITMMTAVCSALETVKPAHVIYISSDAVYADSMQPLSESSSAQPGSLHGQMHLAREGMLRNAYDGPLALLRPTLLYGAKDPHNGYGPNRFRRLAAAGEEIVLFGEGEEQRDHVKIDDVAELIRRVVVHRSSGVLNIATGVVVSFRAIAETVASQPEQTVAVRGTPRQGEMPHNGYRPFDPAATRTAFPDFQYTPLLEGLQQAYGDMVEAQR